MISTRLLRKSIVRCFLLAVLAVALSCSPLPKTPDGEQDAAPQPVRVYTYRVVNAYPHDRDAYTQGLAFDNGILYEGTGLYGRSSLRRVDLKTGRVLQVHELPAEYFGEGITIFRDTIIQLTWQSRTGFVYDRDSFRALRDFPYEMEGWGITHDGKCLIMSDGTPTLYFLDAGTFTPTGRLHVHDNGVPVSNLNELEYIGGRIYANVWRTDRIAIIDPQSGRVTAWLNLSGLLPPEDRPSADVLNGIAYYAAKHRLFVTGKLWPWLFEIDPVTNK